MNYPLFTGACTALITPFRDGAVDYDALEGILSDQIAGHIQAIVAAGTTGEAPTLSEAEWTELLTFCRSRLPQHIPLIAGIGGNDTEKAVRRAETAGALGCDAVLLSAPYYNRSNREGLYRHFVSVAENGGVPLIVYHVPSRTGVELSPELIAALSEHPGIVGIKDAGGNMAFTSRAMTLCRKDFAFWSGNDSDTLPMMALGGAGVISVASNLLPAEVEGLCEACLRGDYAAARMTNRVLEPLFHGLFTEVNPIPVKTAMAMRGYCTDELRLPLWEMSPSRRSELNKLINTYFRR